MNVIRKPATADVTHGPLPASDTIYVDGERLCASITERRAKRSESIWSRSCAACIQVGGGDLFTGAKMK